MNKIFKIDNGDKVVFIFLSFTYFLPLLYSHLLYEEIITTYKVSKPGLTECAYFVALISAYFLLKQPFKRINPNNIPFKSSFSFLSREFLTKRYIYLISFLAVLPLWFIYDFGTYRYSAILNPISQQSPILYIFVFAHIIIYTYFFWRIFFSTKEEDGRFRISDLTFSIFCILTISGTFAALMAVIFLLFSIFPRRFKGFVMANGYLPLNKTKAFLNFTLVVLVFSILLILAITLGTVLAKSGDLERVIADWADSEFYLPFVLYLGERISVHFYAFSFTISEEFKTSYYDPYFILYTLVDTFWFRLDTLAGGIFSVNKPDVSSVSHINFLVTSNFPREGEGTAPGLLASMNYIFPLPLALLTSALLLNLYSWVINNLRFPSNGRISILGCVLFYFFTKEVFYSPIDLLLIFDEGFIVLFILCIVLLPYLNSKTR